jgi:hypothetical protein
VNNAPTAGERATAYPHRRAASVALILSSSGMPVFAGAEHKKKEVDFTLPLYSLIMVKSNRQYHTYTHHTHTV